MYIKLNKKEETLEDVWYYFYSTIAGETYLNDRGRERVHLVEKKGLCVFDKKAETLLIDWTQTDNYFKDRTLEQAMMQYKLTKYNQINNFPDMADIATG